MAAPNYFRDRVQKLRDLLDADQGLRDKLKDVLLLPDRGGEFVKPDDMPCIVIVPDRERHTPYSARTGLECRVLLQVWAYVNPSEPTGSLDDLLGIVAQVTKALWTNIHVALNWWAINPDSDPWLDWTYAALHERSGQLAVRVEAEVRLVEGKINLAA